MCVPARERVYGVDPGLCQSIKLWKWSFRRSSGALSSLLPSSVERDSRWWGCRSGDLGLWLWPHRSRENPHLPNAPLCRKKRQGGPSYIVPWVKLMGAWSSGSLRWNLYTTTHRPPPWRRTRTSGRRGGLFTHETCGPKSGRVHGAADPRNSTGTRRVGTKPS